LAAAWPPKSTIARADQGEDARGICRKRCTCAATGENGSTWPLDHGKMEVFCSSFAQTWVILLLKMKFHKMFERVLTIKIAWFLPFNTEV